MNDMTDMTDTERCKVIAHRGFRGIAPENTLLAARKAFDIGARWWELDVAATVDGTLVVVHDDSLKRTTDAATVFPKRSPWTVYDFSIDELYRLDAGSWYAASDPFGQVRAGRVCAEELAAFRGLRIPTLREALELTKASGANVNVEIKDATGHACDAWIVERTLEAIEAAGLSGTTLVSSFNHEYLRRAKAADPLIALGALVEKTPKDAVGLLRELGATSYNPGLKGLKRETVEAVRGAGFEVYVWTVNERADMRRIIEWGVSGIFSDFPDRLLELQKEDASKRR